QGGGIWLDAIQVGADFQSANLTVTGTTVSDNVAIVDINIGGGIGNAGNGVVTIAQSSILGNFVKGPGGGSGSETGQGTLVVVNSTFVGNSDGGAIFADGPVTTISNCTITGNISTGFGGGIEVFVGSFTLNNSIVAGDFANNGAPKFGGTDPDISTTNVSGTGDFVGINSGGLGALTASHLGTAANPLNPLLGPLQNNGGPTLTEAPLPGSPVIDAGVNGAVPAGALF